MKPLAPLYFVHEGKGFYPELAAYRSFFEGAFTTREVQPGALNALPDLANAVCWHIMGFYPHREKAKLVIHDYRSLSVGRLHALKDWIKRRFNAKPDLRLFQNETLRNAMAFHDDVPSALLPMGVGPELLTFREQPSGPPVCDFCYIGAMQAERRIDVMLDSFLRRFGETKTFCLYGHAPEDLKKRYAAHPRIAFVGALPQRDLFPALRRAAVAVNYFPNHAPHLFQTPTKLLEYAALGLRILANEQPRSRETAERFGITCLWGPPDDLFAVAPDALAWPTNEALDPSPFLWPEIIAASGIAALIDKRIAS